VHNVACTPAPSGVFAEPAGADNPLPIWGRILSILVVCRRFVILGPHDPKRYDET